MQVYIPFKRRELADFQRVIILVARRGIELMFHCVSLF